MERNETSEPSISDNEVLLREIGKMLKKYLGETITFCEFIDILNKDNYQVNNYKRDSLLKSRKNFFRKEGEKGRKVPKRIVMKLGDFLKFLDHLSSNGKIDLQKFKETVIHCMGAGYELPGKKKADFQPTIYKS